MDSFEVDSKLNHDTYFVSDLNLCRLLIMNESNYPWLILVPRRFNITEIYQLSNEDRFQLDFEINFLSEKLANYYKADKMNIASIGNIVSQLHVHIIVRKKQIYCGQKLFGVRKTLYFIVKKI